jgi:glycoside/pentoside/hexuronide:cation symporter, GPH family
MTKENLLMKESPKGSLGKLSLKAKVTYGVADVGLAILQAVVQFFLLFYCTDVAGINPAIAGSALLTGKLTWDAINDPLFGYLSDRTESRFGRRRPYMLFCALPLGLGAWLLFSLPAGLTGVTAFFAVLVTYLLFDTFHTMISIPYYAMTPELTYDYDERTSLTTVRMIFSVFGYILGAAATLAVTGLFQSALGWSKGASFSGMGAVFGAIATITVLTTALRIREPRATENTPSRMPAFSAIRQTFRNRPFMRLMTAIAVANFSFTLLTTLVPYFLTYQLAMGAQVSFVMLAMLGTIGLCLFPMKLVSQRMNKGPAFAAGLFIAAAAIIFAFFLPHGPSPLIYVIAVVAGIGFSGQFIFPATMVSDVVELDQKETGERHEGIYFGIWAFLGKLTGALGIAVSGWGLALFGYVPNGEQSARSLLGIRLCFALIPPIVFLLALPLLMWYPITRKKHAALLDELHLVRK